jgi:hypothetical protein
VRAVEELERDGVPQACEFVEVLEDGNRGMIASLRDIEADDPIRCRKSSGFPGVLSLPARTKHGSNPLLHATVVVLHAHMRSDVNLRRMLGRAKLPAGGSRRSPLSPALRALTFQI